MDRDAPELTSLDLTRQATRRRTSTLRAPNHPQWILSRRSQTRFRRSSPQTNSPSSMELCQTRRLKVRSSTVELAPLTCTTVPDRPRRPAGDFPTQRPASQMFNLRRSAGWCPDAPGPVGWAGPIATSASTGGHAPSPRGPSSPPSPDGQPPDRETSAIIRTGVRRAAPDSARPTRTAPRPGRRLGRALAEVACSPAAPDDRRRAPGPRIGRPPQPPGATRSTRHRRRTPSTHYHRSTEPERPSRHRPRPAGHRWSDAERPTVPTSRRRPRRRPEQQVQILEERSPPRLGGSTSDGLLTDGWSVASAGGWTAMPLVLLTSPLTGSALLRGAVVVIDRGRSNRNTHLT